MQRNPGLRQASIDPRTGNQHFTSLRNQAVQQLRTHTHRLLRAGTSHRRHRQRYLNRTLGLCIIAFSRLGRWLCTGTLHTGNRLQRAIALCTCGLHVQRRFQRIERLLSSLLVGSTQSIKVSLQLVKIVEQGLNALGTTVFSVYTLNSRLQTVRHFAQSHGAGQTGTALECVQGAQHFIARLIETGATMPATQCGAQLGEQVNRLFFKDGEQVEVNVINRFDVGADFTAHGHGMRNGFIDAALQLSFLLGIDGA